MAKISKDVQKLIDKAIQAPTGDEAFDYARAAHEVASIFLYAEEK